MKRFVLLLAICLTACSGKDFIQSRAEYFVRKTYNDVDRIFPVRVDTVTVGDNLDFRISQAADLVSSDARLYDTTNSGFYFDMMMKNKARLEALDSLKMALGSELDKIAAYNCIVAYNNPSNIVWVQLGPYGNLLNITKDLNKLLINPGNDAPGYFELNSRFH